MAKRVLLIAYNWPPSNTAGVQRPLRFARHLPQFGWEPAVLAARPLTYEREDPALLAKMPPGLLVLRVPHRDPWLALQNWRAGRLRQARAQVQAPTGPQAGRADGGVVRALGRRAALWVEPRLYHPDRGMTWIGPAVQAARQRFAPGHFDAVWATGGPWSDFEVGYQLARAWRVPLVLDFRDGWTITPSSFALRRPAWARRLDAARLVRLFDAAQAVVLLHGGYAEAYLAAYPRLDAQKIHLISNGFEPGDLNHQPIPPRGEYFDLVYAGTLHGRQYDTLLLALQRLVRQRPLPLRLTILGEGWQEVAAQAAQLGLSEHVLCLAPQPYAWTANRLAQAHALLLLGEYPKPGYELFVASKLFQYLALRRPILAVVPPNAAGHLLRQLGAGRVADVASLEQVEAALIEMLDAWETDSLDRYLPAAPALADYAEPGLSAALARALENDPPCRPYCRGAVTLSPSLAAGLRGAGREAVL